jgi:hypothetical protein
MPLIVNPERERAARLNEMVLTMNPDKLSRRIIAIHEQIAPIVDVSDIAIHADGNPFERSISVSDEPHVRSSIRFHRRASDIATAVDCIDFRDGCSRCGNQRESPAAKNKPVRRAVGPEIADDRSRIVDVRCHSPVSARHIDCHYIAFRIQKPVELILRASA